MEKSYLRMLVLLELQEAVRLASVSYGELAVSLVPSNSAESCIDGAINGVRSRMTNCKVFVPSLNGTGTEFNLPLEDFFGLCSLTERLGAPINARLRNNVPGGWQHSENGHLTNASEYDIRRAYYWAALQGLPDARTYQPANDFHDWKAGILDVMFHPAFGPYPYPYPKQGGDYRGLMTREECEVYGVTVFGCQWGVTWRTTESQRYRDVIEKTKDSYGPKVWKRVTQAFWGGWSNSRGVERVSVNAHGEEVSKSTLRNNREDQLRAHIVHSRVRMRVFEAARSAIDVKRIRVDSLLCVNGTVATGNKEGDFVLKRNYGSGILLVENGMTINPQTGEIVKGLDNEN